MKKIAFLFSGQGAQYPGMMKDLAEKYTEVQELFNRIDHVLDRSVQSICFFGSQDEQNFTHNTQPCVYAADLAAYTAITIKGIKPDVVAGFSLGEYAAMTVAGVIDLEQCVQIVQRRADYMQATVPVGEGGMAALLKISEEQVLNLCAEVDGFVAPANYNCPGQIVVSGESRAIDQIMDMAKDKKIRAVRLAVSAPFHCDMMKPAADKLKKEINDILLAKARFPIYMNVDACPETDPTRIREKIIAQAYSPVRWEETLIAMEKDGINTFVELGPGKTLTGFVKKTLSDKDINYYNVEDDDTLNIAVSELTK